MAEYPTGQCRTVSSVSLEVLMGVTIILVPYITQNMTFWPEKLLQFYPNVARATLKITMENELRPITEHCYLTMKLVNEHVIKKSLLTSRSRVPQLASNSSISKNLSRLGTRSRTMAHKSGQNYTLEHENHFHYILHQEKQKQTFQQVNAICNKQMDSHAFSFLSIDELLEVSFYVDQSPAIVFTAFHRYKEVSKICS